MPHQKHNDDLGMQNLDSTAFTAQARKYISNLNPVARGYLVLATGLFLLLFSLGFFEFLKLVIGTIGIGLIFIGTLQSHLIETVTGFIRKMKK